jgi:hypothetical protein
MKFADARQRLLDLADGKYCSLEYSETFHEDRTCLTECKLYIADYNWVTGKTWDEAFEAMLKQLRPDAPPQPAGESSEEEPEC